MDNRAKKQRRRTTLNATSFKLPREMNRIRSDRNKSTSKLSHLFNNIFGNRPAMEENTKKHIEWKQYE